MNGPMTARRLDQRWVPTAVVLAVALVAVVVYLNSLGNGFAYDDESIIKYREAVHSLRNVWELVRIEYWPTLLESGLYRPLTLLTFAVEWTLWNGSPFGFHLTNVVLHAAVTALVALFLLRLFPWWAALAGGLVFAVHPIHTEAVANVVGRSELLTALFALAASVVYMQAVREGGISLAKTVFIAALYAAGSLSKEAAVVIPGLLLVTDLPLIRGWRKEDLGRQVRLRLPLFLSLTAVLAAVLAVRWAVLGAPVQSVVDRVFALDDSFTTRLFTMARVWPRYFELLFFPLELSADYSPAVILPVDRLTPTGAVGFLLLGSTAALAAASLRRAPEFTMAIGWAAVALLPVSNLLITAEIVLAERTLYLPSIAVSIVAAMALARIGARGRRWVAVALILWIVGFSVGTVRRNPVWYSTETVFDDIRRKHPESSRMLWILGHRFRNAGYWEEAKKWFERSLEIWPYHAPYQADYAVMLERQNELEEADRRASLAVELEPGYRHFHRLRALIRMREGDMEAVLEAVDEGLRAVGPDAVLYSLQADAYSNLGDLGRAVSAQEKVIRDAEREDWGSWFRLAHFRAAAGDTAAALAALRAARAAPDANTALTDSTERAWAAQR